MGIALLVPSNRIGSKRRAHLESALLQHPTDEAVAVWAHCVIRNVRRIPILPDTFHAFDNFTINRLNLRPIRDPCRGVALSERITWGPSFVLIVVVRPCLDVPSLALTVLRHDVTVIGDYKRNLELRQLDRPTLYDYAARTACGIS